MKHKSTPNRANNQTRSSGLSDLQRNSLLLLEQATLHHLHILKSYFGKYDFVKQADIDKCERELAAFYERQDVKEMIAENAPSVSKLMPARVSTPVPVKRATPKKTIHLIRIIDDGHLLTPPDWKYCPVFLDRYTSSGTELDCDGNLCYRINEFEGELWFASGFIVSKGPAKK